MLNYILFGAAVLIALFVVVVAMQPSAFRITRKLAMSATSQQAFAQVNDFRNWIGWSPWEKYDPTMRRTYEGPPAGAGAVYAWKGNKQVGEGRATITESRPNEIIRQRLEFFKPFVATNDVEFTFKPEGDQTVVSWSMTGKKNFMFKAMGLFMNMDKMCGDQFAEGLANLKSVVEGESKQQSEVQVSGAVA